MTTKVDSAAIRPPMGWNSYNCFGGNVTEKEVKANADYMSEKLKQFGWEYVVIDFLWFVDDMDSWQKMSNRRPLQHIDQFGRLIPSTKSFPSSAEGKGFKPLADYIHSKGLKFGIHIMRGLPRQAVSANTPVKNTIAKAAEIANLPDTCVWYGGLVGIDMTKSGAQEYYNSLFELYAQWGVDYIKVDDISYPYHADEIEAIRKAIDLCGRPIVLSLSPGPAPIGNPRHLRENANLWRISADFWDQWPALERQLELCRDWAPFVTQSHWPDADMLPLGRLNIRTELKGQKERNTNFTEAEQYFLMTLWSIFRSPLMFGGNMPDNDEFTYSLISNEDVIRVNQNTIHNREISFENGISIWIAEDKDKDLIYLALLNINDEPVDTCLQLSNLRLEEYGQVKDLWLHQNVDIEDGTLELHVELHGARLLAFEKDRE